VTVEDGLWSLSDVNCTRSDIYIAITIYF